MSDLYLTHMNMSDPSVVGWLYEFMHTNTIEDDTIILPKNPTDLIVDGLKFFEVRDLVRVGIVSYKVVTPHLVDLQRTMIAIEHRGKGYAKELGVLIEEEIRSNGFGKIMMSCYSTNTAIIRLKLGEGYVVEGFLRNHYAPGKHDYIFGKELV